MDGSGNTSTEALFSTNCSTSLTNYFKRQPSLLANCKTDSEREQRKRSEDWSQEVKKPTAQGKNEQ